MTVTEISRKEVRENLFSTMLMEKKDVSDSVESMEYEPSDDLIDIEENLKEDIKAKILELSSEEMEEFIAGVFRGIGYKTALRGSHTQADGGYDIIVSKDDFGLDKDTILVEVKHRKDTKISSSSVRSFDSVLNNKNRKGIYFSSGGFTSDVQKEFKNSGKLSFMDLDNLVNLIFQYYDKFDLQTRSLLPLKKVYILDRRFYSK